MNSESFSVRLRASRWGVLLALGTTFLGFALGGVFGAAEDAVREGLKASGMAVLAEKYGGDEAKLKAVTDKSWAYYKRAHLHGGAIGTAVLAALLLLASLTRPSSRVRSVLSIALGTGALGYSSFWLLAARAAPGLGGAGAAKDALEWLAVPSAGLLMLGLLVVAGLTAAELFMAPPAKAY